ncbi:MULTISPECIES: SDR family NAD(P)-dependent oxidoreductase [Mycobacterium]|uniref:Short chain dehydrogenase/reductase n=1 Tax=Mycobacterium kiyosense TaxID=2871094 RepID=A0A9P3Q4W8_9MYCO|nr:MULTISPECIES: SDR family NAD(P)-dependent oxidoreductase [Mycobacterium]BDB40472.1 putative short chain dehydrogenase/reductase [Mycobacterium kiyosense]BDE12290.1 putative short chain dehydrogenase/reductase [Mycobacterium sp. 20KCMC460]GLB84125.1 putative short chain dehydrogenase/reductase [Mycobacterium kiyosense]GLB88528.1 putative short chain dehydrogenase/reductase [Mycobacterium kiyosense]GLB94843.1 putative short chain dehydrogenase/reductase [Mycobacterium kiyosense]
MIGLPGAIACVTGGARGIGAATAEELVRRGARVWIGDLDADEARRTAARIGAHAVHLDVTDPDSVAAFHTAAGADGPVAMLVNNAGIQYMGPFVEQKLSLYHREVAVNLGGVINGMHEFLPGMLERDHGHIVNVASMAAKVTTPGMSVYCATKYAVAALSRAVRAEIAGTHVTLTTVFPTAVHTELTSGVSLDLLPTRQPADIAAAIADSARRPRNEVTVPRWLAPFGLIEEVTPEPLLQRVKHLATLRRPPGHYDPVGRRAYLDRIGR